MERNINEVLAKVQAGANVPKGRENKFQGYRYRSLEDINAVLKPLCTANSCGYRFTDEVLPLQCGGEVRWYLKATATFFLNEGGDTISADAWAREEECKKGSDGAQITGLASSYARKYAACALFAIDSGEEVDAMDNARKEPDATDEDMAEIMAAVERFAEMCGKTSTEVMNAALGTKTMRSLGADGSGRLTRRQAAAMKRIVRGWIDKKEEEQ